MFKSLFSNKGSRKQSWALEVRWAFVKDIGVVFLAKVATVVWHVLKEIETGNKKDSFPLDPDVGR